MIGNQFKDYIVSSDDYGKTCACCGKVLRGYGFQGKGDCVCFHESGLDREGRSSCIYCGDLIETQ